jgi:predicted enzyme related to lactoylglutathione lyase
VTDAKKFPQGTFCWADLGTKDAEGAKAFYQALFPWSTSDMVTSTGATYTLMRKGEKEVCGIYAQARPGVPTMWQVYFSVDSADAFAQSAEAAGGRLIEPPFDVMDVGRMAVLRDPTGAAFVAWEGRKLAGAMILGEPDTLVWCEAETTDLDRTVAYYAQVFSWNAKVDGEGPKRYVHFKNRDRIIGGAMLVQKEWGPVPSHWAVCFAVGDVDGTAKKAKEAGGRILIAPKTIEGTGRLAVIADPQGATFHVMNSEQH